MLSRLKAGLARFEQTHEADLIGLVVVFALPLIVLFLGALFAEGM